MDSSLTIFSTAKPFVGQAAIHQTNAIRSWARLRPRPTIMLFGDEPGVARICAEVGALHVPDVERFEGLPFVDDLFARAEALTTSGSLCYANCDVVFLPGLLEAVTAVRAWSGTRPFLIVGARRDLPVADPIDYSTPWEVHLRERSESVGDGSPHALDYFVFSRGLYPEVPRFVVGRAGWDNWMIHGAREAEAAVVDVSPVVRAIHQSHGYADPDGKQGIYRGAASERNRRMARSDVGSRLWLFGIDDADHVLTSRGIRRGWRHRGVRAWVRRERRRAALLRPSWVPFRGRGARGAGAETRG